MAVIALRSRAPLIPAYIHGKIRFLRRTHVYFGEPIDISDLYEQGVNAEAVNEVTRRIRSTFLALRDRANGK